MEISQQELQLATRNHGMPLELLREPLTPLGLHYLLVHYDVPAVDEDVWRLGVGGRVARELTLSLAELRALPAVTLAVTMECAGNGRALLEPRAVSQPWLTEAVGTAEWTGTPLRGVLEQAGLADEALEVLFTGLDRGVEGGVEQFYERALPVPEALRDDALLAYAIGGRPLTPQHGFPLRLVVPGWYGMTNVKWLDRITVLDEPFAGYQHTRSYRMRQAEDDEGEPVTRMLPRSLMVPPGIPDFLSRERFLEPGAAVLRGRAWSGWAPIESVEVSTDGGREWAPAELEEPVSPVAWCGWSFAWEASAGRHELCCRASDADGRRQPVYPPWNLGGYANNGVQRVVVNVSA
jgi:DMSO/TMAO reductase YedYZ molybdopterin-dependent catalytic subunit